MQPGDETDVYALLSDERVVRFMLFPVFTREHAERFVSRLQQTPTYGTPRQVVFALQGRSASGVIGLCGLVVNSADEAELWYLLRPELWGRGLVTEAVGTLVDRGIRSMGLHRIWATCLPENPGSARVLEKLGFRHEGCLRRGLRIHGTWRDANLYALLDEAWPAGGECR